MAMNPNSTPLSLFMYRLKAPDTRRQYPARLKRFFDFVGITDSGLEGQCENFVKMAVQDPRKPFELIIPLYTKKDKL